MYRRAIDISRAGQSEDTVSPMVLNNYAKTLRSSGALKKRRIMPGALTLKRSVLATNWSSINRYLGVPGFTLPGMTQCTQLRCWLVEPRLQESPPEPLSRLQHSHRRRHRTLVRSDVPTALKLADRAVAIDEAAINAGGEGSYYLQLF